jgi:hypothetical protein
MGKYAIGLLKVKFIHPFFATVCLNVVSVGVVVVVDVAVVTVSVVAAVVADRHAQN